MADDRNSDSEDISEFLGHLQIKIDRNEKNIKAMNSFMEKKVLPSICWVPDQFHKMNEGAYTPSLVAIGPFHRGKKHLQAMEGEKVSYMHFLFHRTGNFEQTRNDCVVAMLEIESSIGICYADHPRLDYKDDKPVELNVKFAEMMLIDGCFIIELFYRSYLDDPDIIMANSFTHMAVQNDLVLLENQLPFKVLEALFPLTVGAIQEISDRPSLIECVLSFFGDVPDLVQHGKFEIKNSSIPRHILHLLHSCYYPEEEPEELLCPEDQIKVFKNFKYSATELDLGGIKFVQGNKDIFNLKFATSHRYFIFSRRGKLEIPVFTVNDGTELLLRNFIAFEQSCPFFVKSYFSSHAFLMDRLINTAEDVKVLQKAGIIVHKMGSCEVVAHLFNNLSKNIPINCIYSTKDCLEVINFQKQLWPKFIVKLRRDYFSNPWTVISVFAGSVLFVLTLLQTIYTMRS